MTTNDKYTGNIVRKSYPPQGHSIMTQYGWIELDEAKNDDEANQAHGYATLILAALMCVGLIIFLLYVYGADRIIQFVAQ